MKTPIKIDVQYGETNPTGNYANERLGVGFIRNLKDGEDLKQALLEGLDFAESVVQEYKKKGIPNQLPTPKEPEEEKPIVRKRRRIYK